MITDHKQRMSILDLVCLLGRLDVSKYDYSIKAQYPMSVWAVRRKIYHIALNRELKWKHTK